MAYTFAMLLIKVNTLENGSIQQISDTDVNKNVIELFDKLSNNKVLINSLKNNSFISMEELVSDFNNNISEFSKKTSQWYNILYKISNKNNRVNSMYNHIKAIPSPLTIEKPEFSKSYQYYKQYNKTESPDDIAISEDEI